VSHVGRVVIASVRRQTMAVSNHKVRPHLAQDMTGGGIEFVSKAKLGVNGLRPRKESGWSQEWQGNQA
jgi:hypothetical protein